MLAHEIYNLLDPSGTRSNITVKFGFSKNENPYLNCEVTQVFFLSEMS